MMSQEKIWICSFLSISFVKEDKLLTFGPKQYFYLTHSAGEYFEKLAFKKKCYFKWLYLKSLDKFRMNTNILQKLIQFSLRQACLSPDLQTCLHGRGLWPLKTLGPLLPAGRCDKKLNNEAVKDLDLLFFVNFVWKWGHTFENLIFWLTHQSNAFTSPIQHANTLKNWHLKKKNATLSGCIPKARAISESKLTFCKS